MRNRQMWMIIGGLAGTLSLGAFAAAADQPAATTVPGTDMTTQPTSDRDNAPADPQMRGIAAPAGADKRSPAEAPTAATAPPIASGKIGDPTWTATKLHRINQAEIKAAKMELAQGESAKVKSFAAQLVRDHERAERQLATYAKQRKIDLAATPATAGAADNTDGAADREDADDVQMQATLTELKREKGAELDRTFASTMLTDHARAMDLVRNARAATQDRKLQVMLDGLLPTLETHHRMAAALNNSLGGTSSIEPTHQ